MRWRQRVKPIWVAWAMALAGALFFAALAVQRHNAFLTTAFDLGNYDQAVWNTARGRPFQLTNIPGVTTRLAHHVEPILLLLAPIYWVWSDPRALLIVQSAVAMLGAVPVYRVALRHLKHEWAALAFPLAWVLFPALEKALLFDFHAVALAPFFLAAAFDALDEQRDLRFALFAALAAATKEEIGLLVALMGLYALGVQRRPRLGLITMVAGAGWSVTAIEVIIPRYSPEGEHVFLSYYEGLGNGFIGLVITAITKPWLIVQRALEGGAIPYLAALMAPVAFLSLLAPHILLIASPSLAVNLLSSYEPMRTLEGYHYPSPIVPFVVLSAAVGLAGLGRWTAVTARRWGWSDQVRRHAVVAGALIVIIASLLYHRSRGATPLAADFEWPRVTEHHRIGERIIALIPPEAAVSAQWRLNPHVSRRERVYQYPDVRDAEYVLLDVTINSWPQHPNDLYRDVQAMLAGEWGVVAAQDGWILLQRGGDQKILPDPFYDFARAPNASPTVPVDIQFGNALRLVGFDVEEEADGIQTTLYWERTGATNGPIRLWPYYFSPSGQVLEDTSQRPLVETLWYPPERWRVGEIVRTRTLPWPVPEPFGLAVSVWSGETWLPPTVRHVTPPAFYMAEGAVWIWSRPPDTRLVSLDGGWPFGTQPAPTVLERVSVPDGPVRAGSTYTVTLQWRAGGPTPVPLTVFTQLLDGNGRLVAQHDGPPAGGLRPTHTRLAPRRSDRRPTWHSPAGDTGTWHLPPHRGPVRWSNRSTGAGSWPGQRHQRDGCARGGVNLRGSNAVLRGRMARHLQLAPPDEGAIAAGLFGLVERLIGTVNERVQVGTLLVQFGHAQANGDRQGPHTGLDGHLHHSLSNALGDKERFP
ncbi:MAG: DUF2079 domain-containing protein [Ardenticatenia bacterium]|nr:DUF2079 domain-containing protein [Ardenticatenia bacterium]